MTGDEFPLMVLQQESYKAKSQTQDSWLCPPLGAVMDGGCHGSPPSSCVLMCQLLQAPSFPDYWGISPAMEGSYG